MRRRVSAMSARRAGPLTGDMTQSSRSGRFVLSRFVLGAATVATGLIAGAFYVFACAVMPGLARGDDRVYVTVMRDINEVIQNPVFFLSFLGAPALTAVAAWQALGQSPPTVAVGGPGGLRPGVPGHRRLQHPPQRRPRTGRRPRRAARGVRRSLGGVERGAGGAADGGTGPSGEGHGQPCRAGRLAGPCLGRRRSPAEERRPVRAPGACGRRLGVPAGSPRTGRTWAFGRCGERAWRASRRGGRRLSRRRLDVRVLGVGGRVQGQPVPPLHHRLDQLRRPQGRAETGHRRLHRVLVTAGARQRPQQLRP